MFADTVRLKNACIIIIIIIIIIITVLPPTQHKIGHFTDLGFVWKKTNATKPRIQALPRSPVARPHRRHVQ